MGTTLFLLVLWQRYLTLPILMTFFNKYSEMNKKTEATKKSTEKTAPHTLRMTTKKNPLPLAKSLTCSEITYKLMVVPVMLKANKTTIKQNKTIFSMMFVRTWSQLAHSFNYSDSNLIGYLHS